ARDSTVAPAGAITVSAGPAGAVSSAGAPSMTALRTCALGAADVSDAPTGRRGAMTGSSRAIRRTHACRSNRWRRPRIAILPGYPLAAGLVHSRTETVGGR